MSMLTSFSQARRLVLSALVLTASVASAQPAAVTVEAAWARATVQGQRGTGAFMNLTAAQGTRLVGISTPVAGVAEVHEMKMDGDVMTMRAVPALDLPAGKTVQLKAGSFHLMLMDLKKPLVVGSSLPLTLIFLDGKGVESQQALTLPVRATAPTVAASGAAEKHDHKH